MARQAEALHLHKCSLRWPQDADADAEKRRKLAKVLTQTENPAVLKTVDNVLKGMQGIFGGGKKAAAKPAQQNFGDKTKK